MTKDANQCNCNARWSSTEAYIFAQDSVLNLGAPHWQYRSCILFDCAMMQSLAGCIIRK